MDPIIEEKLEAMFNSIREHSVAQPHARDIPWRHFPETMNFHTAIANEPKLDIFDDTMQVFGDSATRVERQRIADWIIERANDVGCHQAYLDVCQYLDNDTYQATHVMLLAGLIPKESVEFGNGIRLESIHTIPKSTFRDQLIRDQFSILSSRSPCVLVDTVQLVKIHGDEPDFDDSIDLSIEKFDDIRLILSIAAKQGPQAITVTLVPNENVPILAAGAYSLLSYRSPNSFTPPLIPIVSNFAIDLFDKFAVLDEADKAHLRIPMKKLNEYYSCGNSGDKIQAAIDLRTCLDSLFLDQQKSDMRYKLALRAAMYLGNDIDERREIQRTVKKAYDAASGAVHQGTLGNPKKPQTVSDARKALDAAAEYSRKAIIKMIENPRPDWESLELGSP